MNYMQKQCDEVRAHFDLMLAMAETEREYDSIKKSQLAYFAVERQFETHCAEDYNHQISGE